MAWSVWIEAAADVTPEADQLELLAEELAGDGAAVAGGAGHPASVQFAVEVDDPVKAAMVAVEKWRRAARAAGLAGEVVAAVHLTEWERFEGELDERNFPELVGVSELARLLGVSRQRAHMITGRPDFPQPVAKLSSGPIWTRPSVQLFVESWQRKPGRPAKLPDPLGGIGAPVLDRPLIVPPPLAEKKPAVKKASAKKVVSKKAAVKKIAAKKTTRRRAPVR